MAIRRIGQILVDLGFLREEQLETLLEEQQQRPGEMIGQIAISLGLINDDQLAQGLAEQMGMQVVSLSDVVIPTEVLTHVTEPMAHLYRIIPLKFEHDALTIAMCDPQKLSIIDELRSFLGYDIKAMVCTEKEMLKSLDRYYSAGGESVETLIADMEEDDELAAAAEKIEKSSALDLTGVEALADSAPVRKLLNMVLLLAIREHASDLHFEPFESEFKIRIRSDGVLYEMVPPPRHLAFAITTRVKVMADLN
ncbi:MAG: Flp pilus assembly complex ATPase component TadA, partial [Pirellulales bacterium]|nr:Flp pilus assembly complex ATPase component TadA [Pirellulales bacterium]